MNPSSLHEEIRELNLSYLLLARQMLQEDRAAAIFRLGINEEMAELVAGLGPAQLLKMAATNMLLCRFRFDEKLLLALVADQRRERLMPQTHAAILMAGQPAAALAA